MWRDFVDSWDLFGPAYTTGWLIAVMLALAGVVVVAQRQVFLGVAVAQASTLGIAFALWAVPAAGTFDHHGQHDLGWILGIAFAVAASMLTAPGNRSVAGERADAIGAWIFLAGSSLSVLLLSHHPHGLEEVQRLMFSSLIGADEHDMIGFGILAALAAAATALRRREVLLLATDPETALAVGLRVRTWSVAVGAVVGLAIGSAIHSAGTLYTFGCLVLPALAAKNLCRRMQSLFVAAPLLALATGFVGFVLANHHDYPPAQMAVGLQVTLVLATWAVRPLLRRATSRRAP